MYGLNFGESGVGISSLLNNISQRFSSIINSIPSALPVDYPLDKTLATLRSIESNIRLHTPWNNQPTKEGHIYWQVPGICNINIPPMNPMLVGSSGSSLKGLKTAIDVYDAEQGVSSLVTGGCILWTIGGGLGKVVIGIKTVGLGAIPFEGIYWSGIAKCATATTVMGFVDLGTRFALLPFIWNSTAQVASDMKAMQDFSFGILEDIKLAINAPQGTSNYYACSPNIEIRQTEIPSLTLGPFDRTGSGTAHVQIKNNHSEKTATVQVFLEALKNEDIIGIYASNIFSISQNSTQNIPIEFTVPNSNLFFADKYTARFIIVSSGGVYERLSVFRVCSPLACFLDNISDVLNGVIQSGQSQTANYSTQSSTRSVDFIMSYPGSDFDLHVYDQSGRHVGMNYQTGQVDLQIPRSSYSGTMNNPEMVTINNPGSQQFRIEVIALSTEGPESFSVIAVEKENHPASLVSFPSELTFLTETPDTITTNLLLGEIGGHDQFEIENWSISDLQGRHGNIFSSSNIMLDLSSNIISPSSSINGRVTIYLPSYVPPDTFAGIITINSQSQSLQIPIRLITLPSEIMQYRTLTQGFYGNLGGLECGVGLSTQQLIINLLSSGNLMVGQTGRSFTLRQSQASTDATCIIKRLPAGGTSKRLPLGDAVFTSNCGTTPSLPLKNGRFNNNLLGQTITLGLNMRYDLNLGNLAITGKYMVTQASDYIDGICGNGDDIAIPGTEKCFYIPQSVLNVLGSNNTVNHLFALANLGLAQGGSATGVTGKAPLDSISKALEAINDGFDKARFLVGFSMIPSVNIPIANNDVTGIVPTQYSLISNYPNPFNPTTTIQYSLPTTSTVKLTIYDLLGREVVVLVDGVEDAGYKSVEWNAVNTLGSQLASGTYFYRLEATDINDFLNHFKEVRKMFLVK